MIARPQADEYAQFYAGYIQRVPDDIGIFTLLSNQPEELHTLLASISDEQASIRPAEGEWSIKEVMGHICDGERVFAYRALRIARADTTPLPGFEQNDYVEATDFNQRSLTDLIEEFTLQRHSNLLCFKPLTEAEFVRRGTASNNAISVRAILFIMAGHVMHHIESFKTSYGVKA